MPKKILIVDNGSLSTDVLSDRLVGLGAETTIVSLGELYPEMPDEGGYDGVVLTGTDVPSTTPYVYDLRAPGARRVSPRGQGDPAQLLVAADP